MVRAAKSGVSAFANSHFFKRLGVDRSTETRATTTTNRNKLPTSSALLPAVTVGVCWKACVPTTDNSNWKLPMPWRSFVIAAVVRNHLTIERRPCHRSRVWRLTLSFLSLLDIKISCCSPSFCGLRSSLVIAFLTNLERFVQRIQKQSIQLWEHLSVLLTLVLWI